MLPLLSSLSLLAPELGWEGWFTIVVLLAMIAALIWEIRSPDIVMVMTAGILAVAGAITPKELLIGFSNDVVLTIALLCVVVKTWEVNGIVQYFSEHIMPKVSSYPLQLLYILLPIVALSAFMNNTVIILMMTPAVITWAIARNLAPSKYLIPISYVSIVGGLCTLIGTSTNLVVDGLLRQENPELGFSFFELALVGVPISLGTIGLIILLAPFLLPERKDVASAAAGETKEFTAEFQVEGGSSLIGQSIGEINFPIIEIEREGRAMTSPRLNEVIKEGDRLVFTGDIHQIAEIHTIQGLTSVTDPHFKLNVGSSHFSEVVITPSSVLIGKTVKSTNFRNIYGASVLAIYRQGRRLLGKVGDTIIDVGDTLVLLSSEEWPGERFARDFYNIRYNETLAIYKPWRALMVLGIAFGMVALAAFGVPIMTSVLAATLAYIFTRSITIREAGKSIVWSVLLLIASSFAVAKAVEETGVAAFFAHYLLSVLGTNPYMLVFGILVVVCISSEIFSNNTSALLLFPIAWKVVQLAGYEGLSALKAVGVTVAVGSSCAFALPIGYQTHMIVYGPGGYKTTDFVKIGVILDLFVILLGTYLVPIFWPLTQ